MIKEENTRITLTIDKKFAKLLNMRGGNSYIYAMLIKVALMECVSYGEIAEMFDLDFSASIAELDKVFEKWSAPLFEKYYSFLRKMSDSSK